MSTAAQPLFDMSKARPIFDMSKAQPIGQVASETEQPSTYSKLTAGYNPNVEDWAEKHPVLGPVFRFLDATGGAVIGAPEATARAVNDLVNKGGRETGQQLGQSVYEWLTNPNVRKSALSLAPEALGAGVGTTAASEGMNTAAGALGQLASKAPPALRQSQLKLAQTVRDPLTGKIQSPYELVVDKLLPDPNAPGAIPAKSIPAGTNFGQFLLNQKLAARQAALEAKNAPPPDPFAGMTSSAQPGGQNLQLPAVSQNAPKPLTLQDFLKKTPQTEATPSKIIDPNNIPPVHVEGSYWSFKEPALRKAVLGGDRDAALVYKQRFGSLPAGASYLTDVGQGTTRGLYRSAKD